jgi:hypothetical protein
MVNPNLTPRVASIPDGQGDPQTVACSRDDQGVQSEFIEGLVLVRPNSQANLDAFLERYDGIIISDDTIPQAPAALGIVLTDEQRKPVEYLVRINLDKVEPGGLAANGNAAGITGLFEFSSQAGLLTFAAVADAVAVGFDASPEYVSFPDQAFPLTLLNTQERPDGMGGFADAFTTTRFQNNTGSQANVHLAWQFLAAHGVQRRVEVAIIDSGFWLNTDGTPRGTDSDFPANPIQYDFIGNDYFADGPNTNPCSATNPCFWHGTGAAGVATGLINNMLGDAGTGGLIADPFLFKNNGFRDQINRAIRTAVAWGADVVSMSFGGPCDQGCRIYDRKNTPFNDAVNAGSRTVFIASAGNSNQEVSDPNFVHPCIEDHVVCVGALDNDATTKIAISNFGARVDVFTPTNIPVMSQPARNDNNPAGPASPLTFGGTSASAPFLAGIAAMVKAINPDLTGDQVAAILRETAHPGAGQVTRFVDAYAAVRRAAEGIAITEDRFDNGPVSNDLTATVLNGPPPYNQANLNLDERDRDYFKIESPGRSLMTVDLQYPEALGALSILNLESLGQCGSPVFFSDAPLGGGRGHRFVYRISGGFLQFAVDALDVNAYNLSIGFGGSVLAPDTYESNDTDATATRIYSFKPVGSGIFKYFEIDPRITIEANLHSDLDRDHYIIRGVTPTLSDLVFFVGVPAVKVYGNESPLVLEVYRLNPDNTRGPRVDTVGGASCTAEPLTVRLDPDVRYLVTVAGVAGRYTLTNGVDGDRRRLPILVRDQIYVIRHPGEPVERVIRYPEHHVFIADPAYSAVRVNNPRLHLELFNFDGNLVAVGEPQQGSGERLSLLTALRDQVHDIQISPLLGIDEEETEIFLDWIPVAPARISQNLILNPGAEIVVGEIGLANWSLLEELPLPRLFFYDDEGGAPSPTGPGPEDRGIQLFAGGDNGTSGMSQTVAVDPAWQQAVNEGRVKFRLTAFLGGTLDQADNATVRLTFVDDDTQTLGQISLPPVTPLERDNKTGLFPVEVADYVPARTVRMFVDVIFNHVEDDGFNDGYADNLELVLSEIAP